MAQLDTTDDYRRKIEEYFARRPLSRSRRCSPTSRQNYRSESECGHLKHEINLVPSRTRSVAPAVVQPLQPGQQVHQESSVRRISNNQPEHGVGIGFDDDARFLISINFFSSFFNQNFRTNNRDENIDNQLVNDSLT